MRRAALPVAGLVFLVTPMPAVALVAWWLAVAAEMPGRSRVRRALFGLVCVFATTAAVLTCLAVLRQPCNPRLMLAVVLVMSLAWRLRRPARAGVPLASVSDRWSLGFGAVTFASLYLPFVGASTGRTMALLSHTTDGATHVQLVMAVMRHRGFVHLMRPSGLSPGADHYPTAWHGNVWVLSDLLLGSHPPATAVVRLVAAAAVLSYAVLCALLASVVVDLAAPTSRSHSMPVLGGLVCLGLSTTVGFGIFLLQLASYPQVVAMVALAALVLAAQEGRKERGRTLVVGAGCSIALLESWYLLAPVLAAIVLWLILQLKPPGRLLVVVVVATLPFALYPVLTGPSSTQADTSGPRLLPTILGVLGLLLATAVGCAFTMRLRPSDVGTALVVVTVASLLTTVALVAKQGFVAGSGVSYYGAKVLLTTLLLGTVLASVVITTGLASSGRLPRQAAALAAVGVLLGTVSTARAAIPPTVGGQDRHREDAVLDAVYDQHPHGVTPGVETWVLDGCDRIEDRIATKWLYDTSLAWTPGLSADLAAYAAAPRGDVSMLLSRLADPKLRIFEIYFRRECDPIAVDHLIHNPKVRVIRVS